MQISHLELKKYHKIFAPKTFKEKCLDNLRGDFLPKELTIIKPSNIGLWMPFTKAMALAGTLPSCVSAETVESLKKMVVETMSSVSESISFTIPIGDLKTDTLTFIFTHKVKEE